MDDSPPLFTSLSEDTCASLDAIVVHESLDYFLVEITTPRARALIDERDGFLERLLALNPVSTTRAEAERSAALDVWFDTIAPLQYLPPLQEGEACDMEVPGALTHPFTERPSTNTWHPESSSREFSAEELVRAERSHERARQMLEQRIRQKS